MKKYFLAALIIAFGCQSKEISADLIIKGGTIYTMDDRNSVVEAVADTEPVRVVPNEL